MHTHTDGTHTQRSRTLKWTRSNRVWRAATDAMVATVAPKTGQRIDGSLMYVIQIYSRVGYRGRLWIETVLGFERAKAVAITRIAELETRGEIPQTKTAGTVEVADYLHNHGGERSKARAWLLQRAKTRLRGAEPNVLREWVDAKTSGSPALVLLCAPAEATP